MNPGPEHRKTRLAVVIAHPTQYYSPWFRWLGTLKEIELKVFYLWDFGTAEHRDPRFGTTFVWDIDLLGGYEHEFVPNRARHPGTEHFWGLYNPELSARVSAWRPSAALVFGYRYRTHLGFILGAAGHRLPLIFRGDSHLLGQPSLSAAKRFFLSRLYARFAAITYVGAANREYFRALGVPDSRLHFAPHAVEASRFDPHNRDDRAAAMDLRARLGIPRETVIALYAGKFHPDKRVGLLLQAWRQLGPAGAALVLVGDGPERTALEAAAAADTSVHFLPFANQREMPSRYLMADFLVLPSGGHYETWGLSVNEAMHSGLPCLVSDRVGCQRDLVEDGVTGWVFRADDGNHLRQRLAEAVALPPAARAALGSAARVRAAGYSYSAAAAGLLAAASGALAISGSAPLCP